MFSWKHDLQLQSIVCSLYPYHETKTFSQAKFPNLSSQELRWMFFLGTSVPQLKVCLEGFIVLKRFYLCHPNIDLVVMILLLFVFPHSIVQILLILDVIENLVKARKPFFLSFSAVLVPLALLNVSWALPKLITFMSVYPVNRSVLKCPHSTSIKTVPLDIVKHKPRKYLCTTYAEMFSLDAFLYSVSHFANKLEADLSYHDTNNYSSSKGKVTDDCQKCNEKFCSFY